MLPPEDRLVGAQLERYIEGQLYWVLHAPRQSGKTTFLLSWMRKLNATGQAVACYVSVERCQEFPDAKDAIPAISAAIRKYADAFLGTELVPRLSEAEPASALSAILKAWAALVRKWYSSPAAPGGFAKITLRGISPEAAPIVLEPRKVEEVEVLAEWVRTLR